MFSPRVAKSAKVTCGAAFSTHPRQRGRGAPRTTPRSGVPSSAGGQDTPAPHAIAGCSHPSSGGPSRPARGARLPRAGAPFASHKTALSRDDTTASSSRTGWKRLTALTPQPPRAPLRDAEGAGGLGHAAALLGHRMAQLGSQSLRQPSSGGDRRHMLGERAARAHPLGAPPPSLMPHPRGHCPVRISRSRVRTRPSPRSRTPRTTDTPTPSPPG
jgi:hypothetical protein